MLCTLNSQVKVSFMPRRFLQPVANVALQWQPKRDDLVPLIDQLFEARMAIVFPSQFRRYRLLRVEGMECEGCARHVTEALNSVPGVCYDGIKPGGTFTHHLLPYYDEFESTSFIRFAEQAGWKSDPIRFVAGSRMWF